MMGIDRQIQARMALGEDRLRQEYALNQQTIDLLALQQMARQREANTKAIQASLQTNPATVKDQLEQQELEANRQGIAAMMPGVQMQGQRMAQAQARKAAGLSQLPSPNMARMAGGGIVAFDEGGEVTEEDEGGFMQVASDVADWATDNPADAISMGLMFIPGLGWGTAAGIRGLGALARFGKPIVQKYGPRVLETMRKGAQATVTKPTTKLTKAGTPLRNPPVRGPGGKMQSGGVKREFSPMRTSFTTGAGLGIGNALFGDEEETEAPVQDAVQMLEETQTSQDLIDDFAEQDKVAQDYRAAMVEAENVARQAEQIEDPEEKQNFIVRGISAIGSIFDLDDEKFDQLMAWGTGAASGTNLAESLRLAGQNVGATRLSQQARRDALEKQRRTEETQASQFEATMALEREKIEVQKYVAELGALKGYAINQNDVRKEILDIMSDISKDTMQVQAIRQAIATRDDKDLNEVTQNELSAAIRNQAIQTWEMASGISLNSSGATSEEQDPELAADLAKYLGE